MSIYCEASINHVDGLSIASVPTAIQDGRHEVLSWMEQGFELRPMPSAVTRWDDPTDIVATHHPEIVDVVTAEVGCDAVLFYPAIVRDPTAAARSGDLAPIEAAHSDYTEDYRSMLVTADHPYLDILAPSMAAAGVTPADLAAAKRILTLQFWRNIGPPRPDRPLAFCDATTVARDELTPHLVESYGGVQTSFHSFLLNPPSDGRGRRWFTFPAMEPDEVVLFRAFDSERAEAGEPFWTPHTAFVDPVAGPGAPPRESVEIRAICLFD
ncbi:MAG: CmcJ/NvfI family oxidoreductase [Actinomycetota bacterium]